MIIDNETENGILKEPQMSKNTRRESMLEYIRNAKQVTCEELSNHFNVTEETIRKDLTSLSAVSYTHLDVYKRQLFINGKWFRFEQRSGQ